MNKILKTCKVHGDLTENLVYKKHSIHKEKKYPYFECKKCIRLKKQRLYKLNPEKHKASAKKTQLKYREKVLKKQNEYHIKKWMTLEEYEQMLIDQDYKCKICKNMEDAYHQHGKLKRLSIDHDHSTGKIRGLLCTRCNTAIGLLKDSIGLLESAIKYLSIHS